MKKIRLNVDALEVSSFITDAIREQRGTVRGASGYSCYETVGYAETLCLYHPISYWGEASCLCPPVEDTDPSVCPIVDEPTVLYDSCLSVTGC